MIIVSQVFICSYLLIFITDYLISDTNAYFNDSAEVSGTFQAGTWEIPQNEEKWDKSSLTFTGNEDQMVNACGSTAISVSIMNTGSKMQGPSQYEVYYINQGNPKNGESVGEGEISSLDENQAMELSFTATNPGNYKFRAFQRPGHANKSERQDLWSETISVKCENNLSPIEENQSNENKDGKGTGEELEQNTSDQTSQDSQQNNKDSAANEQDSAQSDETQKEQPSQDDPSQEANNQNENNENSNNQNSETINP